MLRKIGIIALAVIGACAVAQADPIVNGQFAAGSITPLNNSWSTFNTISGWYSQPDTFTSTTNPIEIGSPSVYGLSGGVGNNLELNSDGASQVSQDIAGLGAGKQLTISFLDGYRFDPQNPNVNTNSFNVLWNGTVVGSFLPTSSTMSQQSVNVTAQAGTNTLTFQSTSVVPSSTFGGEIENVTATPEPAAYAVFGVGLFGLLRRKRK